VVLWIVTTNIGVHRAERQLEKNVRRLAGGGGGKFQFEEDVEGVDPWDSFPRPEILGILQDRAKLPFYNCCLLCF
jgi:hypothetical protein